MSVPTTAELVATQTLNQGAELSAEQIAMVYAEQVLDASSKEEKLAMTLQGVTRASLVDKYFRQILPHINYTLRTSGRFESAGAGRYRAKPAYLVSTYLNPDGTLKYDAKTGEWL